MFLNTALYKINYTPLIFFSWGSSLYGLSGSPKYNLHMNRQVMLQITTAFMLFHHDIYMRKTLMSMFSIELFFLWNSFNSYQTLCSLVNLKYYIRPPSVHAIQTSTTQFKQMTVWILTGLFLLWKIKYKKKVKLTNTCMAFYFSVINPKL